MSLERRGWILLGIGLLAGLGCGDPGGTELPPSGTEVPTNGTIQVIAHTGGLGLDLTGTRCNWTRLRRSPCR
jgi:hypothetical protein